MSCIEAYNWENRVWLIMPYMNLGKLTNLCLDRFSNKIRPFSEQSCKYLLYRVCHGLLAFHKRNMLHRDIKSDNVFLTNEGDVKLADLGFSVFLSEEKQARETRCGTLGWMAPELICGQPYAKSVDIWSLGILAYECATFLPPFLNADKKQTKLKILTDPVPKLPKYYSIEF